MLKSNEIFGVEGEKDDSVLTDLVGNDDVVDVTVEAETIGWSQTMFESLLESAKFGAVKEVVTVQQKLVSRIKTTYLRCLLMLIKPMVKEGLLWLRNWSKR